MNREFLKQAGVPEDQIDKIMAEYGKDIQAEKDKAAKAASDIAERDKTIETYKTQAGPRAFKRILRVEYIQSQSDLFSLTQD